MNRWRWLLSGLVLATVWQSLPAGDPPQKTPREALRAFNDLIGSWRGTATPAGTTEEQRKNFWVETIAFEWQFKKDDAWIKIDFDKSKRFASGTLRYVPAKDGFEMTIKPVGKDAEAVTFAGELKGKVLTLEREAKNETHRLVFTFLHSNRFLYRHEVKPADKNLFAKQFWVGATKEGEPFAAGDGRPECIVTGGLGTMPVTYMGTTYHVCCSGCRDAFQENPAKYVKEYEAKKAKKKS